MKPFPLIVTCICSSTAASLAFQTLLSAGPVPAPAPEPVDRSALADLRSDLDTLRAELRVQLDAPLLVTESRRVPADGSELDEDDVAQVVRSMVEADAIVASSETPVTWPGGTTDARSALERILAAGINGTDAAALWAEAAENGQLHELLAAMEEHMADLPETAGKHYDRARAYYSAARAFPSNGDGNWWVDSNNAYTQALELDPAHWDARYEKARNMAFWPVAYGGQAEAIRHFEVLARQQEGRDAEPRFADTYVWLGNLYDQQGRLEDARAAWTKGLSMFPGNDRLAEKLATLNY